MRELLYLLAAIFMLFILHVLRSVKRKDVILPRKENICREILEELYGVPFPNSRPTWLLNKTGYPLELDCYNEGLQLALEYNGEQHYKFPNFTNCTYREFLDQQDRDALKAELCHKRGVKLLVVPYTVPTSELKTFITQSL